MAQQIDWYKTPVSADILKEMNKRSDFRGLLQAGSFLIIYLGLAFLGVWFFLMRMWIPMVLSCYAHSIFSSFVGMEAAVHELSHKTPFKSTWLNELFYYLFCFLTWNNAVHFRISHMNHHRLTMHRGLDKEVIIEPAPFGFWDRFSWVTFDVKKCKMIMVPAIANFFGNADVDPFSWDPLLSKDDPRRKDIVRWARILVIGQLILLAVFIYFKLWPLIYMVTIGYFFATFAGMGTGIIQHQGMCSSVPDWRVSCHTVLTGPVIGYLYWRMNYHIDHHMYLAVPFFRLKKFHALIAYDQPEPPTSFSAGLNRIRKIHRRQRTEPGYCFIPEFPESAAAPRLPDGCC
ncbi:MAG: hypothetical protein E4H36_12410 [Spirochaetales bacterium]|nr:MAG: hypothetical protein E4H36_12410 [Spirochaetales bacterium]